MSPAGPPSVMGELISGTEMIMLDLLGINTEGLNCEDHILTGKPSSWTIITHSSDYRAQTKFGVR